MLAARGVTGEITIRQPHAALPALAFKQASEGLLVYSLLLKAALRPKVDVSFIFLLSGIYHQDDICSLYLKLSLGLFVAEPTDGSFPNEIIGSAVVVGLFDDGRRAPAIRKEMARTKEPPARTTRHG